MVFPHISSGRNCFSKFPLQIWASFIPSFHQIQLLHLLHPLVISISERTLSQSFFMHDYCLHWSCSRTLQQPKAEQSPRCHLLFHMDHRPNACFPCLWRSWKAQKVLCRGLWNTNLGLVYTNQHSIIAVNCLPDLWDSWIRMHWRS